MFHVEQSNTIIVNQCPVCGKNDFITHLLLKDYFLSQEEFSILKCTHCGLMITNPQPKMEELGKYYQSKDYISHSTEKSGNIQVKLYNIIRKRTLKTKLSLLSKYTSGYRLLDIGCAIGVFLDYCRKHGYHVMGIEPELKARQYAKDNFNLDIHDTNFIEKIESASLDVVTMWHVLEHVSDIEKRINSIHRILTKEGTAIIALPNPDSYDAKYYQKYWAAYDVPRHLFHFTKESFSTLCERNSFKVISVIPMVYDSFYVSMLSEKYKNSKIPMVKAFLTGLKSNIFAMLNNKNYSSLIYIVKKAD